MVLDSINIENLRSINKFNMTFEPGINLIYGKNGQGKTSLLEAIYILSISRSFKSHFLRNIITDGKSNIKIIGKIIVSNPNFKLLMKNRIINILWNNMHYYNSIFKNKNMKIKMGRKFYKKIRVKEITLDSKK